MTNHFTRRTFLAHSAVGVAGAALARIEAEAADFQPPTGKMPTRVLGKTGVSVGILALGGYSAVVDFPNDELAALFIHACIDSGMNYLDTAPVYEHKDNPRSRERGGCWSPPTWPRRRDATGRRAARWPSTASPRSWSRS